MVEIEAKEAALFEQLTQVEADILIESLAHLRHRQIRISDQRKGILAYLIHHHHHPTAEQIHQDLVKIFPSLSLATVYNNLTTFIAEGLVAELKFAGVRSHFDFRGDQHGHVRCNKCGQITDFMVADLEQMKADAQEEIGYLISRATIELQGLCPSCQLKADKS